MSNIKLFQNQEIRSRWDADREQWLFSVIDIIQVLTGNERPRKYWNDLKRKLIQEGSEVSEKIGQLVVGKETHLSPAVKKFGETYETTTHAL